MSEQSDEQPNTSQPNSDQPNSSQPNSSQSNSTSPEQPKIDPRKFEKLLEQWKSEENLMLGTLAGAGAAILGGILWVAVTIITNYQLGLIAVAVGAGVGMAVNKLGRGTAKIFGIIGGMEALLGCVGGNLLIICEAAGKSQGISLLEILPRLTPDLVVTLLTKSADAMDLLFYGIAVYEGYKFSFRKITPDELNQIRETEG